MSLIIWHKKKYLIFDDIKYFFLGFEPNHIKVGAINCATQDSCDRFQVTIKNVLMKLSVNANIMNKQFFM